MQNNSNFVTKSVCESGTNEMAPWTISQQVGERIADIIITQVRLMLL